MNLIYTPNWLLGKTLTVLLLLFLFAHSNTFATATTFNKLCQVNKYWLEQQDIDKASLPESLFLTDREWIRFHLMKVEEILRNRNTSQLSASQSYNRNKCLGYLHSYWLTGNFPINDDYSFRTPIFIDKHDNFCAVGYLIKASGHEGLSRFIAAQSNLAYVRQMNYPELGIWAIENGFTVDELAWIQPTYPEPISPVLPLLPNGFDVGPKCMAIDTQHHKLYVGGDFVLMNTNQPAYGVAVYDIDSNKWSTLLPNSYLGVTAMQVYHNDLFLSVDYGGESNYRMQYFSLDSQHRQFLIPAGSFSLQSDLSENVQTLVVWHDTLYAGGHFTFQDGNNMVKNVARWNGSSWGYPGFSVPGQVNAFEEYQGQLIIGGAFDSTSTFAFKNIVAFDGDSLKAVGSGLKNEVYSLKDFEGSLFAGCQIISTADTSGLVYYDGTSWHLIFTGDYTFNTHDIKITTMAVYNPDSLIIGGTFVQDTNYYYAQNLAIVAVFSNQYYTMGLGNIDYGVNAISIFNNRIYVAGDFTRSEVSNPNVESAGIYYNINGIGYCDFADATPVAINEPVNSDNLNFTLFPNPTTGSLKITPPTNTGANYNIEVTNLLGQTVYKTNPTNNQLDVSNLAPGIYLLKLAVNGVYQTSKFVKQ